MARQLGFRDKTIEGGFGGPDKEKKFWALKSHRYVVRIITSCVEFKQHAVDNVRPLDRAGEAQIFNMNCRQEWNDEANKGEGDWEGECRGCDEDYETNLKYGVALLLLSVQAGKNSEPELVSAGNSPRWWVFGADKYRLLSDLQFELDAIGDGKKLRDIELVITLGSKSDDLTFQKVNVNFTAEGHKQITRKAHMAAFKACGVKLLEDATKGDSLEAQKRNLKPRGKDVEKGTGRGRSRARSRTPEAEPEPENEELDLDLEEAADPPKTRRKAAKKKAKKSEPEPEPEGEEPEYEGAVEEENLEAVLAEFEDA